jgi:Tol biopolymer transport system component
MWCCETAGGLRPAASGWRRLLISAILLLPSSALAGPPAGPGFTQITASGVAEPVSISGVVLQDVNRNGIANAGDRGLPGILVTLRREEDGAIVGGTTTGPDGSYAFDALPTGAFRVEHTPPPGWYQVRPASRLVRAHTVGAYVGVDFFDATQSGPTSPWPTCPATPIGPAGDLGTGIGNASPTMADDGSVAFLSDADLVRGSNTNRGAPGSTQLFLWRPSPTPGQLGTLAQLTEGASARSAPVLSRDGGVVAYIDDLPVTPGGPPIPNVYLISTTPDRSGQYPRVRLTDDARDGIGGYATPSVSNLTNGRYRVVFVKVVRGQQRVLWVDVPAPFLRDGLNAALPSVLVPARAALPSIDASGTRVAYVTPDDGGRSQIALFQFSAGGGTVRLVTSGTNGLSADPRISGDGTGIVFTSTANLVGRGNVDGNQELFFCNVAKNHLAQLTTTASTADRAVSNAAPSINTNGTRIAFLSNAGYNRTNPDGSAEVYLWSSGKISSVTTTPLFDTTKVTISTFDPCGSLLSRDTYATGTVGLMNGAPWIRGDGSQVVFLSNANFVPDETLSLPTIDNRDLSPEIFLVGGF